MNERMLVYVGYAVIGTLALFAFSQLTISVMNPGSFFWSLKLSGLAAQGYMVAQTIVAVLLIVLLLTKARGGAMLCTLFYGYVVAETAWSNYVFHGSVTVGPLPLIGLLLSIVLWFLRWSAGNSPSAEPNP